MTTITFDTLKYTKRLRAAGFSEEQAEAFAETQKESLSEIIDASLTTRADVMLIRSDMQAMELRIDSELKLLRWMMGTTLAVATAVLVRLFIH